MSDTAHKHWWSGWPGAYCVKCGADDPMEWAIGNCLYDIDTDTWRTPEAEAEYMAAKVCPVEDPDWIKAARGGFTSTENAVTIPDEDVWVEAAQPPRVDENDNPEDWLE